MEVIHFIKSIFISHPVATIAVAYFVSVLGGFTRKLPFDDFSREDKRKIAEKVLLYGFVVVLGAFLFFMALDVLVKPNSAKTPYSYSSVDNEIEQFKNEMSIWITRAAKKFHSNDSDAVLELRAINSNYIPVGNSNSYERLLQLNHKRQKLKETIKYYNLH